MSIDPRRIADSKDAWVTALYAKTAGQTDDDAVLPLLIDANGYLLVNLTVGTISISSTASTITNSASNPVNVSLTNTAVTVAGTVSLASTKVTVDNTVTITGTVTPSTTASTITNAAGNPVNVSLTSTIVTAQISSTSSVVTAHLSPTTTVVTVKSSVAGFNVNVATATLGTVTVSLSSTEVTVKSSVAGFNVNVATATLGTVTTSLSSTIVTAQISSTSSVVTVHLSPSASLATVSLTSTRVTATLISGQTAIDGNTGAVAATTVRVVEANDTGRTLTRSTGSLSGTIGSITITPTNGAKVYAYSLSTTSATEVICIFYDGGFSTARELWRVTLMAPSGANSGANIAVSPPAWLFKSRTASAVCLSLSTAALIHYSIAWYDEA